MIYFSLLTKKKILFLRVISAALFKLIINRPMLCLGRFFLVTLSPKLQVQRLKVRSLFFIRIMKNRSKICCCFIFLFCFFFLFYVTGFRSFFVLSCFLNKTQHFHIVSFGRVDFLKQWIESRKLLNNNLTFLSKTC